MRSRTVQAEGFTVTVRGRTRRTNALGSEYLVNLKTAHPDMRDAQSDPGATGDALMARNPRAWSLLTEANAFRSRINRCSDVLTPDGATWQEPFKPDQLVILFDHFLDSEQLPDKTDLWSQVEAAITALDTPEVPADPQAASGL